MVSGNPPRVAAEDAVMLLLKADARDAQAANYLPSGLPAIMNQPAVSASGARTVGNAAHGGDQPDS